MRPSFEEILSGAEFIKWYWLKEELADICARLDLPKNGSKFELRDRLAHYIDTGEVLKVQTTQKRSKFNWAKEELTLETIITDNVSFGPNFRGFMKQQLGDRFSCTSEFMNWVNKNPGKPLADAVKYWRELEGRKQDPFFKREIAPHNMYNQYLRDYMDDNPGATLTSAKASWNTAKQRRHADGFVKYKTETGDEPSD